MAILRKISNRVRLDETTGFGTQRSMYGGRLVNKDGSANIRKAGMPLLDTLSWYHSMIHMPRWKFFALIFVTFILFNLFFAILYFFIGVEYLGGMVASTPAGKFLEAFFFSAQTFTTVGYGRINPTGTLTSAVAALEAFVGLLNFALATGLLYGRFSRPQAFIRYSDNAIMAPYQNGRALMLRLVPYKNTSLTDAEVKLTLYMSLEENGVQVNRFFPLELEYSKVNSLNLSWTVVHPVNEDSPLSGLTREDLIASNAELMIFLKAFDETFSNTVVSRTSYVASEFLFGAKFLPMYYRSEDGNSTTLDLSRLNAMEIIDQTGLQ